MRRRAAARRAFTLIELLVVVAIIAILISILLPSLSQAREQAKAVVCASNQRSLMTAVLMYTDRHNGHFPTVGYHHSGTAANERELSWVLQMVQEAGRDRKIARCPSDRSTLWPPDSDRALEEMGQLPPPAPGEVVRQTSYASNGYTVFPIISETFIYDRLSTIRWPATTAYFVELADGRPFQGLSAQANADRRLNAGADHVHAERWHIPANPRLKAAEEIEPDQHRNGSNYGFLDGHVERLKFEQTMLKAADYRVFQPTFLFNKFDPAIAR